MNIDKIAHTPSVALADRARVLRASGAEIITLQTGEPSWGTCPAIVESCAVALNEGMTRYSYMAGLPELLDAIIETNTHEFGSSYNNQAIQITHGAVQGISAVISSLIEHGDEVLVFEPAWPTVNSLITINGATPVSVPSMDESRLIDSFSELITEKTKALYVNSPNNPTGKCISPKTFRKIIDIADKNDLYVISDEVYRFFQYEGEPLPCDRFNYRKFILVDSFSKKHCMTGWRIGYVSASKDIISKVGKASQVGITHVAPFVQQAAIIALKSPEAAQYAGALLDDLKVKSVAVDNELSKMKIKSVSSFGAFYRFVYLPRDLDDIGFSEFLLSEYGVCVVPGSAYGDSGKGYIRFSFAGDLPRTLEGIRRIANCIKNFSN